MPNIDETVTDDNAADATGLNEGATLNWGDDAPRGGRAVMNRILKDQATVPLFFAKTLIQSLRDVGYNNTTAALCETSTTRFRLALTKSGCSSGRAGRRGTIALTPRCMTTAAACLPRF